MYTVPLKWLPRCRQIVLPDGTMACNVVAKEGEVVVIVVVVVVVAVVLAVMEN